MALKEGVDSQCSSSVYLNLLCLFVLCATEDMSLFNDPPQYVEFSSLQLFMVYWSSLLLFQ